MTGAILALDLATTLGWSVSTFDRKGIFGSGSKSFALRRNEDGGVRYLKFVHFLNELRESCGPFDEIVYEDVRRHMGTTSAHVYGGFKGHMQSWASASQVRCTPVGVGVWKKAVVGRGNALKSDVIKAVERLGYDPIDDNEADAIAILLYRLSDDFG
jgi:Holliday junction resolvasome RuvABC endonuclease subunit